ncbi:hypothetical protein BS78_04G148000 [Paspalum vaginatum]|nr:hypothetical protein BS78_04G148000 [Paspalum vaginatum]
MTPRAITSPAMDNAAAASVFLGEPAGNTASGDLTYTHSHSDGGCVAPPLSPVPRASAPAADARSRLLRSAAASTSGRPPAGAAPQGQGLLLPHHLYRHGVEVDALIRIESERLRAALWDSRRRHASAVARRLRAAEAELARALARNAELDERLRQAAAEGQAWRDAARSHEAAAAGLRAALDDLARQPPPPPPCAEGDAESCCSEAGPGSGSRAACRSCGDAEACVLLLPCRHLCLCRGCELAGAEACPVCFADRNASLHVLLLPCDGQ